MRAFSSEELGRYNGKKGNAAHVACNGKIFDVTASFLWRDGNHQVLHDAGRDLTESLSHAPHGEEMLAKFPVVGVLSVSTAPK